MTGPALSRHLVDRMPWYARQRLLDEFAAWHRSWASDARVVREQRRAANTDPVLVRASAELILAGIPADPPDVVKARREVLYADCYITTRRSL